VPWRSQSAAGEGGDLTRRRRNRRIDAAARRQQHGQALARAFRWRNLLATGVFATVEEISAPRRSTPPMSAAYYA
jgi:hypothetical protein